MSSNQPPQNRSPASEDRGIGKHWARLLHTTLSSAARCSPDGQQEDECLRVLGIELLDRALAVLQCGGAVDAQVLHGAAAQGLQVVGCGRQSASSSQQRSEQGYLSRRCAGTALVLPPKTVRRVDMQ